MAKMVTAKLRNFLSFRILPPSMFVDDKSMNTDYDLSKDDILNALTAEADPE